MVPKVHAKGTSFKGAAAYLLHDKGKASTSERVAWTDTHNLMTEDPDTAWRVMAATAMDQSRLKAEAGVKATGRKSAQSVLHFSLSWHPDDTGRVSADEMRQAALGALHALGASDRQALIISHTDEDQPHVHVLVNRVSAEDGRMLSSSKEKLNLSRWAQGYEEARGDIQCEQRVTNNAARDRGEYVRGEKDQPRAIYDQLRAINDNTARQELLDAFRLAQLAMAHERAAFHTDTAIRRHGLHEDLTRAFGEQERANAARTDELTRSHQGAGAITRLWRTVSGRTAKEREELTRLQAANEVFQQRRRSATEAFEQQRQRDLEALKTRQKEQQRELRAQLQAQGPEGDRPRLETRQEREQQRLQRAQERLATDQELRREREVQDRGKTARRGFGGQDRSRGFER